MNLELPDIKEVYVPVNMMFDCKKGAAAMAQREAVVQQRKDRDQRYGEEINRLSTPYTQSIAVTFSKIE